MTRERQLAADIAELLRFAGPDADRGYLARLLLAGFDEGRYGAVNADLAAARAEIEKLREALDAIGYEIANAAEGAASDDRMGQQPNIKLLEATVLRIGKIAARAIFGGRTLASSPAQAPPDVELPPEAR